MRITTLFAASCMTFAACSHDTPSHSADAGPDPHDLTIQTTNFYTGAKSNIELLAIQDGDAGTWTVLTGTDGEYHAHLTNDRYAIMTACHDDPGFNDTSLYYRHVSDGPFTTFSCDQPAPAPVNLSVALKNLPASTRATVRYYANGEYKSLVFHADGTQGPIVVSKGNLDGLAVFGAGIQDVSGLVRIPKTDLESDQTITIDAAARIATQSVPLTVTGATALSVWSQLSISSSHPSVPITFPVDQTATAVHYIAPPQSFLADGDLLLVQANDSTGKIASAKVKTLGPLALALPAADLQVSVAKLDHVRPTFTYTVAPKTLAHQDYEINANSTSRGLFVTISSAWMGDATSATFTLPDFSAVPGFSPDFALDPTQEIDWDIGRYEDNGIDGDGYRGQYAVANGMLGAFCGNGVVDAGEACDDGQESATCNYDCTAAMCGDGEVNTTAGEECDPPDGTTCSASCKNLPQARNSGPSPSATRRTAPTPAGSAAAAWKHRAR